MAESSLIDSSASRDEVSSGTSWALKLFSKSPLKQQKYAALTSLMGSTEGKTCLDIGADNGVISYLFRQRGGLWFSADLIPETVESIRELVGERVDQINGRHTPYQDNQFDLIVIVDFLEHIETDKEFIDEVKRILKKGGVLIAHVPNPRPGPLRWIQHLLGQTDEAHGHVRPGYDRESLSLLFGPDIIITRELSYRKFFSNVIDTLITGALDVLKGKRGKKGTVVTSTDLSRLKKSFTLYSILYPLIAMFVLCDALLPWSRGTMLAARAEFRGRE